MMRWVLCWYGWLTLNQSVAGSIPATAAFYFGPVAQMVRAGDLKENDLNK